MKVADYKSMVGVTPKEGLVGGDKILKACFPMTHPISLYGSTGIGPWLVCALYKVAD